MKLLNGSDLADYIKERQARDVRALRQAHGVQPKLAIIICKDDPVIDLYVRLKRRYGDDILIDVDVHRIKQAEAAATIQQLNDDPNVHGIILQLPLEDPSETDQLVDLVAAHKDVDALGSAPKFDPATPMAINWLLSGYNVDLKNKRIVLIGQGKLVGAPLLKQYQVSGHDVVVANRETADLKAVTLQADIIITAAGSPALLFSDMVKQGAVVVDAGVASENGKTVGDVAPELYERDDLTITPTKGGVGPADGVRLIRKRHTGGPRRELMMRSSNDRKLGDLANHLTDNALEWRDEPRILPGGGETHYYVNMQNGLSSAPMLARAGELIIAKLAEEEIEHDRIAGTPESQRLTAAVAFTAHQGFRSGQDVASRALNHEPQMIWQDTVHDDPTVAGKKVVMVHDVGVTGSALLGLADELRREEAEVTAAFNVVDTSQGIVAEHMAKIGVVYYALTELDDMNGVIVPAEDLYE